MRILEIIEEIKKEVPRHLEGEKEERRKKCLRIF